MGHAVQADVVPPPAVEYDPAEQLPEHAGVALPPVPYVPALQFVHAPAPGIAAYLPAGHAVHADVTPAYAPPDVEKEPAEQLPVHAGVVPAPATA